MPTTQSVFFDRLAQGLAKTAGFVQGIKGECDSLVKTRVEHALSECEVVSRDEFEVFKTLLEEVREENRRLKTQIEALEQRLFPEWQEKGDGEGGDLESPLEKIV